MQAFQEKTELPHQAEPRNTGPAPHSPNSQGAGDGSDRRTWRRVRVPLKARFMLGDGHEFPARVKTISPAEVVIETSAHADIGQSVIVYVDQIGRLEGTVDAQGTNAIRVRFEARRSRRARTADSLIWIVNRGARDYANRRAIRIKQDKAALAVLEDGSHCDCRILDISITGASVAIDPKPPVGAILTIGKMRGRVVRQHESGIGMEFIKG